MLTIFDHQSDQTKLPEHQTTVMGTTCRCSNVVCSPGSWAFQFPANFDLFSVFTSYVSVLSGNYSDL